MKKSCTCGFWNQEQQECLYNGNHYCIREETPPSKLRITKEFKQKWWMIFKEYQSGQHPGQLSNLLEQMLTELGFEVKK